MWLLIPFLMLCCLSCDEKKTEVKLEDGNPPTFVMSGSGNLVEMSIGLEIQDKTIKPSKRAPVTWKIVPTNRDGKGVETIGKIKYGIVPEGYRQIIPANGEPPPRLVPGNYYYYYLETINAPHANGAFEIRDGKAVRAYGVATCYQIVDGEEIESDCG